MFDDFRKRIGLKNVKLLREAASTDQEIADKFLETTKKSSEEYLPKQISFLLRQSECHSLVGKCHK